ncbi:hypothetical protein POM88_036633 [Heracleum sosnowskyi]|uniref:B3 domain-containing protein n=1 Tax=Heracleum sosnowskyi TaxID=360622 RepID=A0AAD8HPN7_9APIA|nr:hypothetical protein POM88_036633 [Heracleum sosnowskyi]
MAHNLTNGSYSLYQEESRQDCEAALLLCKIKHQILDPQTARLLEEEKLRQKYKSQCSCVNYKDRRDLPPVHGLVGEFCSVPLKKLLTQSDLKTDQRRLLLKKGEVKQYLYPLLSSHEVKKVETSGIYVNVYDGEANIYEMKFTLWAEKAYVLTNKNWIKFCKDYNLVADVDWVTVWMFKHRSTHQLSFAIVPKRVE